MIKATAVAAVPVCHRTVVAQRLDRCWQTVKASKKWMTPAVYAAYKVIVLQQAELNDLIVTDSELLER